MRCSAICGSDGLLTRWRIEGLDESFEQLPRLPVKRLERIIVETTGTPFDGAKFVGVIECLPGRFILLAFTPDRPSTTPTESEQHGD
jgi:hypothetical protein